jgi:hypothetical protein
LGQEWVMNGLGIKMLMHIIHFWVFFIFMNVLIGGENIAHLVQSNKPMYKWMEFYFLNWVQFSYDFGNVVPIGNTQGKFCC